MKESWHSRPERVYCNRDQSVTGEPKGWVYGYGIHLTCTENAFPKMVLVETASIADGAILDQKTDFILNRLQPASLTADDRYTKALRIRNWIKQGTLLITLALRWAKDRYAQAYHHSWKNRMFSSASKSEKPVSNHCLT